MNDERTVERLVRDNLDLARHEARRWLHTPLEQEELVSEGAVGLVTAARRFDPSRGVSFRTFAEHRVRGAITDVVRKRARRAHLGDGLMAETVPIGVPLPGTDELVYEPADPGPSVEELVIARETVRALADLPGREATALVRKYVHGDDWDEIAAELGVSGARAWELAERGAARMRAAA